MHVVDKCHVGYLADCSIVDGGRGKVCRKCPRSGRRCAGSRYIEYVVRAVFIRHWVLILFRVVVVMANVLMTVMMIM